MLRQFYAEHPFTSCKQAIAATAFPGSVTTARERLRASGLKSYRAAIKTELSERNRQDRINFALYYQNMPIDFWKTVIFSDESTFQSTPNTHTRLQCGAGTIWDINGHLTALQYRDILENVMLPSVTSLYDQFTFQHDNSPIHTTNVVQQWITDNNLRLLNWPARSPDLNPIENLWGYIKKRMRENPIERGDRNLLWQKIVQEWEEVTDDYCHKLIESIPSTLEEVIQNNGRWTHY
ncbi:transposable element-related [Holotrichia oblita]|uniref:Transposable element-related n=1 Tax=Holotrichia oblita TaxID=644536 RepID=A0ACB9TCN0_HOLOL|nr:transposable element-related [Holotrichia oblita]